MYRHVNWEFMNIMENANRRETVICTEEKIEKIFDKICIAAVDIKYEEKIIARTLRHLRMKVLKHFQKAIRIVLSMYIVHVDEVLVL